MTLIEMTPPRAAFIPSVLDQHCMETASLWPLRQRLLNRVSCRLGELAQVDERLDAHVDAVRLSAGAAVPFVRQLLATPARSEIFAATALALTIGDRSLLRDVLAVAEAIPGAHESAAGAFEWTSAAQLRGVVQDLLRSPSPFLRSIGISACSAHEADLRDSLNKWLSDPDPTVRACAYRAAGIQGLQKFRVLCEDRAISDETATSARWAAWAAVLLGARGPVAAHLAEQELLHAELASESFLGLQAMSVDEGASFLSRIAAQEKSLRSIVVGASMVGKPGYVSRMIELMSCAAIARSAGRSFELLTGADLLADRLHREKPVADSAQDGNGAEIDAEPDPEEGLAWPDSDRCMKWWAARQKEGSAAGRLLAGRSPSTDHCRYILQTGSQQQRTMAAHYLCILMPGTRLFNCTAPAWRQARRLAAG
ncbi:TIGR02270 family protein [Caballeronia arationis]|uniref:TIGR02270 family protein n=1 Tax=Caballeronia arationis TaxID=1777142 RepID=UPI000B34C3DC|nr:TIGR02270 family protein [Caballeronia arationis]